MSHNSSIRMPEALWQRVKARALQEGRSTNQLMVLLLDEALLESEPTEVSE